MTIIDKRRGGGLASDMAQQAVQRVVDTNVPTHVKTGVAVSGITIGASPVTVVHKLGRVPQGWHVLRTQAAASSGPSAPSDVYETAADKNTITFQRSSVIGSITYSFWVF